MLLLSSVILNGCLKEDLSHCEDNSGVILAYRYDMNMHYTDLFGEMVKGLKAYVFNEQGILCDTLIPPVFPQDLVNGYERQIKLSPGKYTVVTWAGDHEFTHSFTHACENETLSSKFTAGVTIGRTKLSDFRMFLRYTELPGNNDIATPDETLFNNLFHGIAKDFQVLPNQMTRVPVSLIKNTNTIRLKLSNLHVLGAVAFSAEDFNVTITSRNGHYRSDNLVAEYARKLIYTPYDSYIDADSLKSETKVLRLMDIAQSDDPHGNAPMLLNIDYIPANLSICVDLDIVKTILSGKIDARDNQGNLLMEDGKPMKVAPSSEYLDRQDIFDIELKVEKGPEDNLIVTVFVNGWKITNIYPVG